MAKWLSACTDFLKLGPTQRLQTAAEAEAEAQLGQDHIFSFYDELTNEQKKELDECFDEVSAEDIEEAWQSALDQRSSFYLQGIDISSPGLLSWDLKRPPQPQPGANITKISDLTQRRVMMWRSAGLEMLSKERIAVVIMAGGLDTRLATGLPKGTLDIGLLSHKSIFQLYFERVRRLQHLAHRQSRHMAHIPVYMMCNKENRHIIEEFLRENNYFGLREQDVMFFTQGYMPLLSEKGKILLAEKHRIASCPNGNGGIFKALVEQGMVSDMKSRGVTGLYVCSQDNVMAKVGDPVFLGYCEACHTEAGIKCVEKILAEEKFGVFCSRTLRKKYEDVDGDGKLDIVTRVKAGVIESYEVPDEMRRRRMKVASGTPPLEIGFGNLSQYYFKVDFVKRSYQSSTKKWHIIPKSATHIDPKSGERVEPAPGQKNARRLEMFLFDAFEHTRFAVGLEVDRTEYALVKNLIGEDSLQSALQVMCKVHQRWIVAAGGVFEDLQMSTEREDAKCEISPLVSYAGEDLVGQFPASIKLPFYLPSHSEFLEFSSVSSAQRRRPSTHYLDWYSDLAQRELEVEIHATLGPVIEAIEDQTKNEYAGERAEETEVLPPTPRQEEMGGMGGRLGKGKGKGGDDGIGAAAGGAGTYMQGFMALLTESSSITQSRNRRRALDTKAAAAAGGHLALPKMEDRAREKYWGDYDDG